MYYSIQGKYGRSWEEVTAETVRSEAVARLKEYRENEIGTAFRMVQKTEPKIIKCAVCGNTENMEICTGCLKSE